MQTNQSRPFIVLGGGGHAKVLLDLLLEKGGVVLGFTEISTPSIEDVWGVKCLGNDDRIFKYKASEVYLINGIGSVGDISKRCYIFNKFNRFGYCFPKIVSNTALLSQHISIGSGSQVMRGAILQHGTTIGYNTIINSGAVVDHECVIGNHVHISPGAVLSGGVVVKDKVHIGTGAVIIQGITIGKNALVAAGAVVTKNVPDNVRVYGVPAKEKS